MGDGERETSLAGRVGSERPMSGQSGTGNRAFRMSMGARRPPLGGPAADGSRRRSLLNQRHEVDPVHLGVQDCELTIAVEVLSEHLGVGQVLGHQGAAAAVAARIGDVNGHVLNVPRALGQVKVVAHLRRHEAGLQSTRVLD